MELLEKRKEKQSGGGGQVRLNGKNKQTKHNKTKQKTEKKVEKKHL